MPLKKEQKYASALKKEQRYVEKHFRRLLKSHEGEYIVVYGEDLQGHYPDFESAYREAVKRFGDAPFFITRILSNPPVHFISFPG